MAVIDLVNGEVLAALAPVGAIVVKATAVLLLGTVCSMFARGSSSATRHMIWTLTLAGGLAVPVVDAFVPRWGVVVPRWAVPELAAKFEATDVPAAIIGASSNIVLAGARPAAEAVAVEPAIATSERVRPSAVVEPSTIESETETETSTTTFTSGSASVSLSRSTSVSRDVPVAGIKQSLSRIGLGTWLLAIWAIGFLVALGPTVVGMVRLATVARRARPMVGGRWALLVPSVLRELDVRRRVRFVELDGAVMPMTWGVFRPVVLLPAGDFESTIEQRLDVLRHELAHVRRYDCLTQLIGQVACAVYWFNPLVWIAARQLRIERERACDDEVLRAGSKASAYADYLLRVARSTHLVGAAALGGLAMARPSQMAERLMAVLDESRRRERLSGRTTVRALLTMAVTVSAVASMTPVAADARIVIPIVAAQPAPAMPVQAAVRAEDAVVPAMAAVADTVVTVELPVLAAAPSARVASAVLALTTKGVPSLASIPVTPAAVPCNRDARGGKHNHSNWTSSDNGSKRWRVLWSEGDCSYELEARGDIKFNRDVTDIESISDGGQITIEQHIGDDTRRIVVRPRSDGSLERSYSVNGSRREFDVDARAWLAETLVALERQSAFAVDQRVPAILERSGVNGVLQEISQLGGDYARRRYYTKLLSLRQLDRAQVRQVVEQAANEMTSDYELAELLVALSKLDAFSDDSHPAFVRAAAKINSDYERRRALNALLNRDRLQPATVQALLDAASNIRSDYELAELLIDVSKRYAINDQTRPVYIKAVGSIKSDYEHRRVLAAIVSSGGLTPDVNRSLLEDASRINSDYELAEFLIQMGKKGALDATTRDAYFSAADKIKSDYEHRRALTPLLSRDVLTKELAKAILGSAAKIDSDYEAASLLVDLAKAIPIDEDLRPAFERAADTIQGEYEYGRAMSAVRRRTISR
jgi:beta-lactamase regulating signal transducer with metallopeptidase domain